jgi:signal transduction histidine kinase
LFDEHDNQLRLEAVVGINVPAEEYTLDYGQGIAGRVLESGRLINVADVSEDSRVASFPRASHAHSLLVAPIKNRDGVVIGTITLQSSKTSQFTGEDENLLMLLAHQAGLAIENARLYETAEYRRHIANIQREQMRRLTHQVVVAQEDERERIARELHDEAGQSLTALKISLEMLASSLPADMQEVRQALNDAAEQTGMTMENLRSIAHNLRPPALDRLGLTLALAGLCQQFESMTQIQTIFEGIELPRLSSSYEITLYRFVQEALTNIAKHANATEVRVWLGIQTGLVEIHVQDNGIGMQTNPLPLGSENMEGMGLASMEERLSIIDGKLEVRSVLGEGTHLCASVAMRSRESPA